MPERAVLLGMAGPSRVSVATMQYPSRRVDFPNRRMSMNAMRLPSPDLITPLATRKAAKISSIKGSEKPENACCGVRTRVSTTATMARMEAVKMEKASSSTPTMAVMKIAKRCQASGDRPQGMGRCHTIRPNARVIARLTHRAFVLFSAGFSTQVGSCRQGAALFESTQKNRMGRMPGVIPGPRRVPT